jgi:dipeptidyl aminopeptidase/acylaminoacyl peptidase
MRPRTPLILAMTLLMTGRLYAAEKHVPELIESLSRPVVGSLSVAPDGQWLAFVTEREPSALEPYAEKSETAKEPAKPAKHQLWLMAIDGGEAWQATKSETDVGRFRFSKDGHLIVFSASAPETQASKDRTEQLSGLEVIDHDFSGAQLFSIDASAAIAAASPQPAKRLLKDRGLNVTAFAISPDGRHVAFSATKSPLLAQLKDEDVFLLDVSGEQPARPIVTLEGPDTAPHFSPDGKRLLFSTSMADANFFYTNSHLAGIHLDAVSNGPVMKPQALEDFTRAFDENADALAWTSQGVYFSANQKTNSQLFRLDPDTHQVVSVTPSELHVGPASISADGKFLAYAAEDSAHVNEVYLQAADGPPKKLTDFTAKTSNLLLGTAEVVTWKSKDGALIEGVLRKPSDYDPKRKYPLLVHIHGGPTGVDEPTYWPEDYAYPLQNFLAKGALILEPNYRGSAGYGAKFRALNVRNLGVGDMWDVMSGVDSLIAKGIVDPKRLASMGWSEGGYISAFLTTHTDRFKAISVGAGISDWSTYYVSTDITPFTPQYLHATPWDDPAIYAKTSPITTIRQAKTPTLIQHGSLDKRVPVPNSFELYRGLLDQQVDSRLILYTGFGHGINKPKSQLALERANLDWFNHYLWGEPIPQNSALYGTHELPE